MRFRTRRIRAAAPRLVALLALLVWTACDATAQQRSIVVASTTSTEQSGLFGFILPRFTARTGINVKVVAVGTGQALDIGRRGDADVVLVHDRPAEDQFMAEGFGVKRFDLISPDGRGAIADYKIGGQQLFFPDAKAITPF